MSDIAGYLDDYRSTLEGQALQEPTPVPRRRAPPTGHLFIDASEHLPTKMMMHETRRTDGNRMLRYLDDLLRVTGNSAGFGVPDHVEGLVNSRMYGAPVDDALRLSALRTHDAHERLGPLVSKTADALGTLGGYATMLPRLPAWLAGRGMLTPAAIPLEAARGYLETQGDPRERLRGAFDSASDPMSWLNPTTGRGLASNMFFNPVMEGLGLDDRTPRAYMQRLLGE